MAAIDFKERESIIRSWFESWIAKDSSVIGRVFTPDAVYVESYGPVYKNRAQIEMWFADWNTHGSVLRWDISDVYEIPDGIAVKWYFECDYEGNIDGFDGVTIALFEGGQIKSLEEYASKHEHIYPYEQVTY